MRGSVMKRGSTWTYVISLGHDEHGKGKQKWVGGHRTRKEAEDAMVATLERIRTGNFVDPGATTLQDYLDEWLKAVEPMLRITTWRSYEQMLRLWVIPRVGRVKPGDPFPGGDQLDVFTARDAGALTGADQVLGMSLLEA